MQSYPFPPPEPDPGYGYNNQPLLASQQWSQPGDGQGYELNYQSYAADPSPFARAAHLQPQQGYGEHDIDYGDEIYEDEEPRRGKRWLLIAAALVGAIGVGGALAYTYRSLVAPNSRVPVVRADPNVKVKPEQRGGRDLAAADKKLPTRPAEEPAPVKAMPEPAAAEEPPAENHGPRAVKTITITPGGSAAPAPPPVVAAPVPGITVYRPPQMAAPAPPPVQPTPRAGAPSPSGRAAMDTRTPPAETEDDDPPAAAPPPMKRPPVQTALAAPRAPPVATSKAPPPPRAPSSGGGLGYVAVLSSQKTSIDAMKVYADLQQKYPDVLGDKSFEVQEADLSARGLGTMYRVVVGPPGSHHAASGVCAQLKSAGYVGCWVKEY